ncbi:hypothetical protein K438DRAFT_1770284 [Mycena galopus ATCC 62051]|nr:hypothetical protein K438DRAFT_1770284 [Mycena galopus ATCC 62051]
MKYGHLEAPSGSPTPKQSHQLGIVMVSAPRNKFVEFLKHPRTHPSLSSMFRQPNHKTAGSSLLQQVKSKMEKMKINRTPDEQWRAHRDASARYRERHHERLRLTERERAVNRRAHLNSLKKTDQDLKTVHAKAREASARYRAASNMYIVSNREALAAKQAEHRKAAFIKKHGYMTYLKRSLIGTRYLSFTIPLFNEDRLQPSLLPIAWPRISFFLLMGLIAHGSRAIRQVVSPMAIRKRSKNGETCSSGGTNSAMSTIATVARLSIPSHLRWTPPPTHPGTAPCTHAPPAYPATVLPAPSPFAATSTSTSSSISSLPSSAASSTDSLFLSDADRTPQKEEPVTPMLKLNAPPRVTMETRIQLTPTGKAQGAALVTATGTAAPRPSTHDAAPHPNPATAAATPAQHDALAPLMRSVLITPQPGVAPLALVPASAAPAPEPPYTYGIRGVAVFYPSHAGAWAAAQQLGMTDTKILASRNAECVQAYMYGLPFDGED